MPLKPRLIDCAAMLAVLALSAHACEISTGDLRAFRQYLLKIRIEELAMPEKADSDHFLDASTPKFARCEGKSHRDPVAGTTRLAQAALDVMLKGGWDYYEARTVLGHRRLSELLLSTSAKVSGDDETVTLPATNGAKERTIRIDGILSPRVARDWEVEVRERQYALESLRNDAVELGFPTASVPVAPSLEANRPVVSQFCDQLDRITLFEPWNDPEIKQHSQYLGGGFLSWLNERLQGMKFGSHFIPTQILRDIEDERELLNSSLPDDLRGRLFNTILDVNYDHNYDYTSGASNSTMIEAYNLIDLPSAGVKRKNALIIRIPAFSVRRALHFALVELAAKLDSIQDQHILNPDADKAIFDIWHAATDARKIVSLRLSFALAHEAAHHYLGRFGNIETDEERVDCYALWNLALARRPLQLGEASLVLDVNVASVPASWQQSISEMQRKLLISRTKRLLDISGRQWQSPAELKAFCDTSFERKKLQ